MATDQEIRDAGFKYVPQQQYLQNPFKLPEDQEPVVDEGIVNTNAFVGGNSEGYNVYNPDPNTIKNVNYDPYRFRLADLAMYGDEGSDEEYFTRPEPTGLGKLTQLAASFVPGRGIASFIGNYLPVNRRSIMENELAGEGVLVDNIGRIVSKPNQYNTPGGIMSGYNASQMNEGTFTKRQDDIGETLMGKYGLSKDDVNKLISGELTEKDFKGKQYQLKSGKTSNLFSNIRNIEIGKQNFLDASNRTDTIFNFEKEEKEKKRKNKIINRIFSKKKKKVNNVNINQGDDSGGATIITNNNTNQGQGDGGFNQNVQNIASANEQNYQNAAYDSPAPSSYEAAADRRESYRGKKDGGRAGYFYGGRVNYKVGGRTDVESQYGEDSAGSYDSSQNKSGRQQSYGNDNNNNNEVVNNPIIDISTVKKSVGSYDIPYGLQALLANQGKFQTVLNADDVLNKNLGLDFTYDQGPYEIDFNADMEGNKNLGLSYNKGGFKASVNTDFNNPNFLLSYNKAFAHGGLASIL